MGAISNGFVFFPWQDRGEKDGFRARDVGIERTRGGSRGTWREEERAIRPEV